MKHPIQICFAVLLVQSACGGPEPKTRSTRRVALSPRVSAQDQVVARVNGVPILRPEVEQQAKRGQTARAALDELVARELLAQEAARRGLARHSDVHRTRNHSLANLLIRRHFAPHFTKADVPKELLKRAYELNKLHFVRPEMVRTAHILVRATNRNTEDFHRRAAAVAQEIRKVAISGPLTEEEFKQIPGLFRSKHKMMSFLAQTGNTAYASSHPSFSKVAFALKNKGEIGPVARSHDGYHVIYFIERYPAKNITLEQADATLRDKVFKQAQSQAFERWAEDLERRHNARIVKEERGKR